MRRNLVSTLLATTMVVSSLAAMVGCGAGGASSSTPNSQSRQALRSLIGHQELALAQGGAQTAPLGGGAGGAGGGMAIRPGIFGILLGHGTFTGGIGIATSVGVSPPGKGVTVSKVVHYPFIGNFVHRFTAKQVAKRTGRGAITRDDSPTFYFDDYLALWVDITSTDTNYSVLLYEDQAKTKPAGHLTSTFPTSSTTFPQVYHSEFEVTAGTLSGAHGYYDTTISEDGSSNSSYENSFPDGSHSKGQSSWAVSGESNWSDRTEGTGGYYFQTSGQFHSDGSGHTVSSDSAGYGQDYTYNADGSGVAIINGPDPGLPAKMVWDNTGKVTITWADGTVEVWDPAKDNGGGGGAGGGGGTGTGTGGGGGTVTGGTP